MASHGDYSFGRAVGPLRSRGSSRAMGPTAPPRSALMVSPPPASAMDLPSTPGHACCALGSPMPRTRAQRNRSRRRRCRAAYYFRLGANSVAQCPPGLDVGAQIPRHNSEDVHDMERIVDGARIQTVGLSAFTCWVCSFCANVVHCSCEKCACVRCENGAMGLVYGSCENLAARMVRWTLSAAVAPMWACLYTAFARILSMSTLAARIAQWTLYAAHFLHCRCENAVMTQREVVDVP